MASTAEKVDAPPPTIPGYEVLGILGRGGMGVVYRARQVKANRIVALKMVLAGEHAGEDALARFRTEAEALARLRHPGTVQIFEVNEVDGKPYFSMEFVEGGSLAQRLATSGADEHTASLASAVPLRLGVCWPPHEAAAFLRELATAIHAVHQRGIIHRDLKPANILLAGDGHPKITDFGLAKLLDSGGGRTLSGAVLGTPSYMAPEQAGGKHALVGPATDVYALGAILYELLAGRPPFVGDNALDILLQVASTDPTPPGQFQPKLPRALEEICLKCLRKAPENRYPSADALAGDLQRFLDGRPVQAKRMTGWRRVAVQYSVAVVANLINVAILVVPFLPETNG